MGGTEEDKMQVFIKTLSGLSTRLDDVLPSDTILDLKKKYHARWCHPHPTPTTSVYQYCSKLR